MKLLLSALLLAASTAGFAQNPNAPAAGAVSTATLEGPQAVAVVPPGPTDQTGCPVVLTAAHLNWPATYLPVTAAERVTEPNLSLEYQNASGKAIRSVSITARFTGKTNKYALDATTFDLRLTFAASDAADPKAEQMRELRLPTKFYAYGVTRIALDQVTFADGTVWSSVGHSNCALNVVGSAERIGR